MNNTLQRLFELEGVQGAMVISPEGRIVQKKVHTLYDNETLTEAAAAVEKAVESLQVHYGDWDGLVVHFSEGKTILRNLGGRFTLQIIADNTVNLVFANVAINVAHKKLQSILENNQAAFDSSAPPAPAVASSKFDEISMTADVREFIQACTKAMSRSVGPMARVIVKEEVVNLARNDRFTNDQISNLVAALEQKLEPEDLAAFRKNVGL